MAKITKQVKSSPLPRPKGGELVTLRVDELTDEGIGSGPFAGGRLQLFGVFPGETALVRITSTT
ncbi:MAG TPA: hypothetical protein VFR01_00170, partial [Geobacterales bacterium]|nr:hypothetical protein [Geobacterales bacterium]